MSVWDLLFRDIPLLDLSQQKKIVIDFSSFRVTIQAFQRILTSWWKQK